MVSRRKILSRSRDELHSDIYYMAEDDDDDVWHTKSKLYRVSTVKECLSTRYHLTSSFFGTKLTIHFRDEPSLDSMSNSYS